MLSLDNRVELTFWEAGCMIWVGSLNAVSTFCQAWCPTENSAATQNKETLRQLILEHQAVMPMVLYQDDGYTTRIVLGELNNQEQENWIACASWQLNLPTGQLVISGIVDAEVEVPALTEADLDNLMQCYLNLSPGKYAVTVYAYLPDLTGDWLNVIRGKSDKANSSVDTENPLAYFCRTRPKDAIPAWLGMDFAETKAERNRYKDEFIEVGEEDCVEFVVQLVPLATNIPEPNLEESDSEVWLPWEFRKPDRFPHVLPTLL